jgi:hypothetical protein
MICLTPPQPPQDFLAVTRAFKEEHNRGSPYLQPLLSRPRVVSESLAVLTKPSSESAITMTTMFSGGTRIAASESHFSNIGRDQHNVGHDQYNAAQDQYHQHIHFSIADTASHETVQHVLRSLPQQLPFSSSAAVFVSHHNRTPCDLASNLIGEIMRLLLDLLTQFSVDYLYLQELLLKPLRQTLFLTGYALQLYELTPLGPNLASMIRPEVEKCCLLFQDILGNIDHYRSSLDSTHLPAFRLPSLWSGSKVHELTWKLSYRHRQLGQFLVALNSCVFRCVIHHCSLNSTWCI